MFPVLFAYNMGALGGYFGMLAGVAIMTLTGIITSLVYIVQFLMGKSFSAHRLVARILTCVFFFAPALGLAVVSI